MIVSVIIPVYNSEQYLRECIDSVLEQSYTDFELLLINDGSTDSSGKICDEYALKDVRVKVFHKENGGVSSARNLGISKSKGDWITFVDSDDLITDHYFEALKKEDISADLILLNIKRFSGQKEFEFVGFNDSLLNRKDFMKHFTFFPYLSGPYAKFYKTSIIQQNNVLFDIHLQNYEDSLFNLEYIYHCKLIQLSQTGIYLYRNSPGSLSKQPPRLDAISHYFHKIVHVLKVHEHDEEIKIKYLSYPLNRYFFSILMSDRSFGEKRNLLNNLIANFKSELIKTFQQTKLIRFYNLLIRAGQVWLIILIGGLRNKIKQ